MGTLVQNLSDIARDLGSFASTGTVGSKYKKNKMSKKRKDAEKKRKKKESVQMVLDQNQSAANIVGGNCKKFILVDDYIPTNITPI